jgi:hypothetical protein
VASVWVARGSTDTAGAGWQQYPGGAGIYIDVDTSFVGFPLPPVYSTILRGTSLHWDTTGASSIYNASRTGFRVYVRHPDGRALTPQIARNHGWYIGWIGQYIPPIVAL